MSLEDHAPTTLVEALTQRAPLPESLFDGLLPRPLQNRSRVHWTPLHVAARVAELLAPTAGQRILDVGSGVGKLCIVGALTTPAQWVGIEQDGKLVHAAREIAKTVGATRASFLHADVFAQSWHGYDALYFFNPFGELEEAHAAQSERATAAYEATRAKLEALAPTTRVAAYFDPGFPLPDCFTLTHSESLGEHDLVIWTRERR